METEVVGWALAVMFGLMTVADILYIGWMHRSLDEGHAINKDALNGWKATLELLGEQNTRFTTHLLECGSADDSATDQHNGPQETLH